MHTRHSTISFDQQKPNLTLYSDIQIVLSFVCPFVFLLYLLFSLQQDVPFIFRQCIVAPSSCLFIMDLLSAHCHKNHNGKAMNNKESLTKGITSKISLFGCQPWADSKSKSFCARNTKKTHRVDEKMLKIFICTFLIWNVRFR